MQPLNVYYLRLFSLLRLDLISTANIRTDDEQAATGSGSDGA